MNAPSSRKRRRFGAMSLAALLALGAAACEDEDGDGSTLDEEVDDVDERSEDVGDRVQEEVDDAEDEIDDSDNDSDDGN